MACGGKKTTAVDEYTAKLPPEQQKLVSALRRIIRQAAPKIT